MIATTVTCPIQPTVFFKAVRSHTVDSPKIDVRHRSGRPNACNLCHLDQTLEWTAKHLADWFDQSIPTLNEEQRTIAAGPLWTLTGDAGMRALMAWHLGWQPARDADKSDWRAPYLATLLEDPYPAVRVIAARTKEKFPDYRQIAYDFLTPPNPENNPAMQLIKVWQQKQVGQKHFPNTLIGH